MNAEEMEEMRELLDSCSREHMYELFLLTGKMDEKEARSVANREKERQRLIALGPRYPIGTQVLVKVPLRGKETISPGSSPQTDQFKLEPGFVTMLNLRDTSQGPAWFYGTVKMRRDASQSELPMDGSMEDDKWTGHPENMLMLFDEQLVGKILTEK